MEKKCFLLLLSIAFCGWGLGAAQPLDVSAELRQEGVEFVSRAAWAKDEWSSLTVEELLKTYYSKQSNYSQIIQDPGIKNILKRPVRSVFDDPFIMQPLHNFTHIVIHHTGSYSLKDSKTIVQKIWEEHTFIRAWGNGTRYGWGDIGYHFLIDAEGTVYEGRKAFEYDKDGQLKVRRGAHVPEGGGNTGTIGIAFIGNFDKQVPTREAIEAAVKLISWIFRKFGVSDPYEKAELGGKKYERIIGHRDLASTSCPGENLYKKLQDIKDAVKSRLTPSVQVTATVLVMDVSGSMASQWRGGIKIESAKKAALQFIEQVANEPRPTGTKHMIGVVTFSDSAEVKCPLTDNYNEAKKTVISLGTIAWTNLGAGLDLALQELEKVPSAQRFIILLSDGVTNRGKSREEVLATSVTAARAKGICIHTVGFGDPGDIDEDFLRKIADKSGCGSYSYASSGFELFGTYIKIRHRMLGSNRIVEFTSGPSPVRLLPGQTATLGAFQLTGPAQELHYTLAWSEPGQMRVKLVDPNGREVTRAYPGATIYSGKGFQHVTVLSPRQGIWRVSAEALSSFISGVQYYGVVSARTGGWVIRYIPPPPVCFNVLGNNICVPLPDLPTVVVVGIAIIAFAIVLYQQFFGG